MDKKWIVIGVIALVLIFGVSFFVGGLNTVVEKDEGVKAAWAQVENQLKRRSDLIPNLVNTVKGFAAQEKDIFIQVAEARSKLAGSIKTNAPIKEKIKAANQMEGALSRLLMIVERYPDLKSNQNFLSLQDELAGTENRIATERMRYNRTVEDLNTHIRKIPGSFFAGFKGVGPAEYFKPEAKDMETPEVKF